MGLGRLPLAAEDAVQQVVVIPATALLGIAHDALSRHAGLLQRSLLGGVVCRSVALHPMHAVLAKQVIDQQSLGKGPEAPAAELRQEGDTDGRADAAFRRAPLRRPPRHVTDRLTIDLDDQSAAAAVEEAVALELVMQPAEHLVDVGGTTPVVLSDCLLVGGHRHHPRQIVTLHWAQANVGHTDSVPLE